MRVLHVFGSRANAAGALGNMVRNAGTLVRAMIREGAVEALLHTVIHDSAAAPRRIALFSLGNFVGYAEVRELLSSQQLEFDSTLGECHDCVRERHALCLLRMYVITHCGAGGVP